MKRSDREKGIVTFTADTTHTSLFRFLTNGQFILSEVERTSVSHSKCCVEELDALANDIVSQSRFENSNLDGVGQGNRQGEIR